MEPRRVRIALRVAAAGVMLFLYLPLVVIVLFAFNASKHPGAGRSPSTRRTGSAWPGTTSRRAPPLGNSFTVAIRAVAARARARHRWRGVRALSASSSSAATRLAALRPADRAAGHRHRPRAALGASSTWASTLSLWTMVVGHATFCIVVVFNNVIARLRRSATSLEEASMDLGADGWQTFRHVTCRASPPRSWPAGCWRSPCRSTRWW